MGRIPAWTESPELWDKVKLGGATLPGTCELDGSIGLREDIVEEDGGKVRVNTLNYRPAEVEITVSMWEQEHLDKFKEIVKLYKPRKDGERRPLEVLHPSLEMYGITQLYVFDVGLPRKARVGLYQATLKLREFWEEREIVQKKVKGVTGPSEALSGGIPEGRDISLPSEGGTPPPGGE